MTNTAPEIEKCCFHKKMPPYKNGTTKNGTLFTISQMIFKREFLNLLHDLDTGDFTVTHKKIARFLRWVFIGKFS